MIASSSSTCIDSSTFAAKHRWRVIRIIQQFFVCPSVNLSMYPLHTACIYCIIITQHTCTQVIVNGDDVTSSVVNKLSLVVPPKSSTMLTVPVNSTLGPGSLYTVVLMYAEVGSIASVAGGRLAKTHFPIESWPKSNECPYPTVKDENYKV